MAQAPIQGMIPPLAPVPTLVQTRTFSEYYNDATVNEFHGAYGPVISVFNLPGPGATPTAIRDLVSNDPRDTRSLLCPLMRPMVQD
jgi:hypothetical protein